MIVCLQATDSSMSTFKADHACYSGYSDQIYCGRNQLMQPCYLTISAALQATKSHQTTSRCWMRGS